MASYFGDLRSNWRPVAAVFMGLSGGLMTSSYVIGIMAPYLIRELHWTRADFATVGALGLSSVLFFPVVGRLADRVGVRPTAMIGVIASPLICLALSQLHDLRMYAILFALQCLLLVTTTPPVYCRVIVQYVERARGLALAIVACGPALVVAIGGPLLNNFVAEHGWRAGYLLLMLFSAATGLFSILLLPSERNRAKSAPAKPRTAKQDYGAIVRTPAFWIMFGGAILCSLPSAMMMTQLSLVLAENGITGRGVSIMIGGMAGGTLIGRIVSGVALDRFPAPIVVMIGYALSGIGMLTIASGMSSPLVLLIAVVLIGLSAGAEGDLTAYLVVRNFGLRLYGSIFGMLAATTAIGASLGAVLLGVMLAAFGSFAPYLRFAGILVIVGGMLYTLLPGNPVLGDDEDEAEKTELPAVRIAEAALSPAA
jgi:MFS family permease